MSEQNIHLWYQITQKFSITMTYLATDSLIWKRLVWLTELTLSLAAFDVEGFVVCLIAGSDTRWLPAFFFVWVSSFLEGLLSRLWSDIDNRLADDERLLGDLLRDLPDPRGDRLRILRGGVRERRRDVVLSCPMRSIVLSESLFDLPKRLSIILGGAFGMGALAISWPDRILSTGVWYKSLYSLYLAIVHGSTLMTFPAILESLNSFNAVTVWAMLWNWTTASASPGKVFTLRICKEMDENKISNWGRLHKYYERMWGKAVVNIS